MQQANVRNESRIRRTPLTSFELSPASLAHSSPSPPCCDRPPDFEELALPLFDSVYSCARWLSGSTTDAEDLVQETYLKAFRGFATFEPGTNFRAWIFRILKNTFFTSRTSAHQRHASALNYDDLLEKLPSDSRDPVAVLMDQARFDVVQTAMQRLPITLREVMVLCDLEEASYRETAHALSIPVGTVMSRLARARKAVRESVHTPHGKAVSTLRLRE
jgi:RNA polymerase sigma factor (sigma-70 family)